MLHNLSKKLQCIKSRYQQRNVTKRENRKDQKIQIKKKTIENLENMCQNLESKTGSNLKFGTRTD